jgi:proteasome activator subunit 4
LQVSERLGRAEGGDEDGMDVDGATPSAAGGGDVTMGGGDVLPMSTFEQDLGTDAEYVDQLWLGWNVPIPASDSTFVKLSHTGSPSSDDKGWAVVSNFTKAVISAFADQEFVSKACDRMSQDHRLNGDERAEQATSGFPGMPVASAAVSKAAAGRFALPGNFSDKAFSIDNMLTFKVVAQSGGIKACEHLWGVLDKAVKSTSDQEQQCLAAEMVAGLVKGGMAWEGEYAEGLKARLAPIISTALSGASPESLPYWMDALRHIGIQKDPRRLRWMVDIVASLTPEEGSGSPAQLRALKLYKAFAIEFGWRGMTLHNACAPTIRRLMCGESKSVREEAARCLAILSRATQPSIPRGPVRPLPPTEVHASSTLSSAWLKDEAASLLASYTADSAPATGTPENKALMSRIEGVVYYYIHATRLGFGTSVVETSVGALLLMLAIQEDSDRELAQVGKMGYELFATSLPNAAVASKLIDTATEVFSTNKSWRVRNGCIDFIREAGHTCVLHAEIRTRVAQFIQENGLVDNVPEVRQNSCTSLAGFLRMSTSEHVAGIIANAPKPKRRGAKAKDDKSDEERAAMLIRRHAKVLGIASCVLSHPTELPEWMCDAVTALCRLQGEETMISSSISKTVCDFKKSHQDVWDLVKTTWSEDSLQLLSDISGTQSYYS